MLFSWTKGGGWSTSLPLPLIVTGAQLLMQVYDACFAQVFMQVYNACLQ